MLLYIVLNTDKPPAAQITHLFFSDAKANAQKTKELFFANARNKM
jgi:hypothetical protein